MRAWTLVLKRKSTPSTSCEGNLISWRGEVLYKKTDDRGRTDGLLLEQCVGRMNYRKRFCGVVRLSIDETLKGCLEAEWTETTCPHCLERLTSSRHCQSLCRFSQSQANELAVLQKVFGTLRCGLDLELCAHHSHPSATWLGMQGLRLARIIQVSVYNCMSRPKVMHGPKSSAHTLLVMDNTFCRVARLNKHKNTYVDNSKCQLVMPLPSHNCSIG